MVIKVEPGESQAAATLDINSETEQLQQVLIPVDTQVESVAADNGISQNEQKHPPPSCVHVKLESVDLRKSALGSITTSIPPKTNRTISDFFRRRDDLLNAAFPKKATPSDVNTAPSTTKPLEGKQAKGSRLASEQVLKEDRLRLARHEKFMGIPGVSFLLQTHFGEHCASMLELLARRDLPLRNIKVGPILLVSDFADILSGGYVGERVLNVHQTEMQKLTCDIHFMPATTYRDILSIARPPNDDFKIPEFDRKRFICWQVNITTTHWATILHGTAAGSPVFYFDTWGGEQQHKQRVQISGHPKFRNICDVVNELGARQVPPRKFAAEPTVLPTPPQQGNDCGIAVNEIARRIASNVDDFLQRRNFWLDGVTLRIQQAALIYKTTFDVTIEI